MSVLARQAAALLGGRLAASAPLAGGDLSAVVRLRLDDGRVAVAKSGPAPRTEAAMLGTIRASGAPAPAVLAVSDACLVLEDLGDDDGPGAAWEALGAAVARLHAATGQSYGWPAEYGFGAVVIDNAACPDWPGFWAERRLLSGLADLPVDLARAVERLCASIADRLPAAPRPALLHGDLWPGNVVARGDRVLGLIDPACCHGHAEADLAMLWLFARPGAGFLAGYGAPDPGWEERRPVYQLWPALTHLRLFGSGYRGLVERLLRACGAAT